MNRREFLKSCFGATAALSLSSCVSNFCLGPNKKRPNILFAFADDWSWPHASIAGDKVIKTPTFDRIAREGVLFTNAFATAPSCTPSRAAVLTGQYHWRLEESANLWSTLQSKFEVYPDILEKFGYYVGRTRKGWAPGRIKQGGRTRNPAGPEFKNGLRQFLDSRPSDKPFCFWFGSTDPHRPYKWGTGKSIGMNPQDVEVPPFLPDCDDIRTDICDYYWEVQRFDREVGTILEVLEENGELDNTIVVISSDNGMPFPRCKSTLYDYGTHMPLAIRWGAKVKPDRVVNDFVNLMDLAPTFLDAGCVKIPKAMTGRSLLDILLSDKSGTVDPSRDKVFTGRERHTWSHDNGHGYPSRAIRTKDFLYIHNFKSTRWPAGNPIMKVSQGIYSDVDNSPTKAYMLEHKGDPKLKKLFDLSFAKRPREELYDLKKDPWQMKNVAKIPQYADIKNELAAELKAELRRTKDPRVVGGGEAFDLYPYYGRKGSSDDS